MLVIANNITTRTPMVNHLFRQSEQSHWDPESTAAVELKRLFRECADAGADVIEINTQQHYDQPEVMEFGITLAQQASAKPLCLSTNNPESADAGLKLCKRPPLLNYLSTDAEKLRRILPMVARRKAEMVLLVTEPGEAADAETMLKKAAILIGAANEAGVPNERLLVDPGLVHITSDAGQRHFVEAMEFLKALPGTFEPAVRSTCWLSGVSAGAPRTLRPVLESAALSMLSASGLSSVFINVSSRENRRLLRLMKIFQNEAVYSDHDAELY